jgi:ADP-heptose:LPS heptosyltransferase
MKFLVIRRDNIGDLVCTTPLFSALRQRYPDAKVAALVNSYNSPVLEANHDIDEVFIYQKGKHRLTGQSLLSVWWRTFEIMRRLQAVKWDAVFMATTSYAPQALKFARSLHAKHVIGYGSPDGVLTDALPADSAARGHECEAVMRLLEPLGEPVAPGPVKVFPDPHEIVAARAKVPAGIGPVIGIHISARKPQQRWTADHIAELAHDLIDTHDARILLFWSPGPEDDPRHPGDDRKAAQVIERCRHFPLAAYRTQRLEELIAGLSLCDRVICSDGGAMHLAAGLGKPILCFFGNSSAQRWHPWGVPYELLQKESREVADISVAEAMAAYERLCEKCKEI